jgi:hypothetical protein
MELKYISIQKTSQRHTLNSDLVNVFETSDQITFKSGTSKNQPEVIFFQGGLTDPKAYAPLCRELAEKGFTTHLIKMKWRLPQRDYQPARYKCLFENMLLKL